MATSQNGWTVIPNTETGRALLDREPLIRNIGVPNGVRKGDVAIVFRWLADQYDQRVERLIPGWCWGWHVKTIEGSTIISNHASATAVDFNAPDNPMGQGTTAKSMTSAQIAECHALERESSGVLRWGGDFRRNDPMHWEIVGDVVDVRRLATRIQEENMLNQQDKEWISEEIRKVVSAEVAAAFKLKDQYTNGKKTGAYTSDSGGATWAHGIPNGVKPGTPQEVAWGVLRDIGIAVISNTDLTRQALAAAEQIKAQIMETHPTTEN